MTPTLLPWVILFLPLIAAGTITLVTLQNRAGSAAISIAAVVTGFVLTVIFIWWAGWQPHIRESSAIWLSVGNFQVEFGLRFDRLSEMMLLIVTGVASAIHIYSFAYMKDDAGFPRFFACLSLFTFSMLGIVLANNFVELFIFWELVGVSSYLLIGFWFERPSAANAGKKAFITNRLGDFGFLLGILLIWSTLGSLNFAVLQEKVAASPAAFGTLATAAGLLIFCGAMGKSAQFPLHVWLPDAMEGPTPVSALIHAATMVAAGVYMLCRVFFVLNIPDSNALIVIAFVGAFTALFAALIAVQQNDIKRILAYSTLSQLGYMVMAVGLGGQTPAMFHLTTHAFFKALLFLGAGSVIVALHHEQDIWKMGALRNKMPVTFWTFLAGTIALAGVWPFSGFYSKDTILGVALRHPNHLLGYPLFLVGVLVAGLTSFYMFRLVFVVFFGHERAETSDHAHESSPILVWPLRVLAVLSIIGGLIGIEPMYEAQFGEGASGETLSFFRQLILPFAIAPVAAVLGLAAAATGFFAAYRLYARTDKDPLPEQLGSLSRWMRNRFYFDELYEATVIRAHDSIADFLAWFDKIFVGGLGVRGVHGTTEFIGRALRLFQTGNLQTYAFLFALGVVFILFLAFRKFGF
jgi:NADH-quinone oxidoreductase subunit L